jgi:ribosomal protein S18 acetylase RimI-like enzyme
VTNELHSPSESSQPNELTPPQGPHQPHELRLRPMTADELPAYIAQLEVDYTVELHESTGISLEAAKQESRQSTVDTFPDGRIGEHEQVWVAEDAAGARVGVLWLAHREPGTSKEHVWIYDIEVDEARRGEGWGRKLLALAESQTRALGLTSLRLNVFGQNSIARQLYRTQGFTESRVTMVKDVGISRPTAASEPPTASLDIIG